MKYDGISIHDRATLRRVLGILDSMVRRLEGGERIEIADAAAVLGFLGIVGAEQPLVAGIEDALKAKRGMEFVRSSRRLSEMLRDCLSAEGSGAENESVRSSGEPEIQAGLSRLERKYTPPELTRASKAASFG